MNKKQKSLLRRIVIAAVLFVPLYLISEEYVKVDLPKWVVIVLFLIPYLTVGYDILRKAALGIKNKQVFDENFLMAIATIGAIVLGEYGEGVAVMLLYQIGELFQSYAVGKSRKNISELMDIRPDYANIEVDGELEQVDPEEVEVGSIIVVKAGLAFQPVFDHARISRGRGAFPDVPEFVRTDSLSEPVRFLRIGQFNQIACGAARFLKIQLVYLPAVGPVGNQQQAQGGNQDPCPDQQVHFDPERKAEPLCFPGPFSLSVVPVHRVHSDPFFVYALRKTIRRFLH